jgi:hypothetical protein
MKEAYRFVIGLSFLYLHGLNEMEFVMAALGSEDVSQWTNVIERC